MRPKEFHLTLSLICQPWLSLTMESAQMNTTSRQTHFAGKLFGCHIKYNTSLGKKANMNIPMTLHLSLLFLLLFVE